MTHHRYCWSTPLYKKSRYHTRNKKNKNKNSSCPTPHHQTTYLLYHYYTKKLLSQCCPKQLMLEESIISLSLSSLGFLRGKNKFSSSYNACHDFSRYQVYSLSPPLPFNHTPIEHLQTHSSPPRPIHRNSIPPSQSTHKTKAKTPSILQIPTIPPRIFTLRSIPRFIMFRQPQPSHLSTMWRTPLLAIRRALFSTSTKFITRAIETFCGNVVLHTLFGAPRENVVGYVLAG